MIQPSNAVRTRADEISLHLVGAGRVAEDVNAGISISREEIAGAESWSADHIGGTGENGHAVTGVAEHDGAGDIGADDVAQDLVSHGRGAKEINSAAAVGGAIAVVGDQIARARSCAPNQIVRGIGNDHAVERVAQRLGARAASANEIALDEIGRAMVEINPQLLIGRDQIAGRATRSADGVAWTVVNSDAG